MGWRRPSREGRTTGGDNTGMQALDLPALTHTVLWAGFALSALFGALLQRTHFCTMGAVADIVNMGDWTRMRMWVLAVAVAMLGFNTMVGLGWVSAGKSVYGGPQLWWLSALVGGAMFGFGMVLASGCGSKSLVRVGGGNLKSLVVVVLIGLSGFITMKGVTGVWRVGTIDKVAVALPAGQDLPSLAAQAWGASAAVWAPWLALAFAGLMLAWVLWRPEGRRAEVWLGGVGVGLVIVGLWWVSGRLGYVAEDPNTLEEVFLATNSKRMEAMSMVAPIGYLLDWLMFYSDTSKLLSLGIVSVLGVVVGAAVVALLERSFRWEGFGSVEDTANHLVGAVLMGVGGVTAMGCTIGQGLSGVSTLSLGSFLALAGIGAGAVAALRYQVWRMEKML